MEDYPFVVVVRGNIPAYSEEHARDILESYSNDLRDISDCDTRAIISNVIMKLGSDAWIDINDFSLPHEIEDEIRKGVHKIVGKFLIDIKQLYEKPPVFDRRNYMQLREEMLLMINKMQDQYTGWRCERSKLIEDIALEAYKNVKLSYEYNLTASNIRLSDTIEKQTGE